MFIPFNFKSPHCWELCFFVARFFEIVKVGSSTLLTELSLPHGFYLVRVVGVANIHVTWLVYVRTYCVPIATLNQNKPSRSLCFGYARITRITEKRF